MGAERSAVAGVNDGPVDRQSRDRGAPRRAGTANAVTERVLTLFFQTSVFKIRNAATLSVTGLSALCQLSQRESQGRTACAATPSVLESLTCLPLWGRWHGERRDGEGAHAVSFAWRSQNAVRTRHGIPQSLPLRKGAFACPWFSSFAPKGRAKSAGGGPGRGWSAGGAACASTCARWSGRWTWTRVRCSAASRRCPARARGRDGDHTQREDREERIVHGSYFRALSRP